MGMTHYWSSVADVTPEDWSAICESSLSLALSDFARKLINPALERFTLEPNREAFVFDAGPFGCEPLVLNRAATRLGYCKTELMPYDKLVCAILAVAAAQSGVITVTSDARRSHWQPCLDWAAHVLGRPVPMPAGIKPDGAGAAGPARP